MAACVGSCLGKSSESELSPDQNPHLPHDGTNDLHSPTAFGNTLVDPKACFPLPAVSILQSTHTPRVLVQNPAMEIPIFSSLEVCVAMWGLGYQVALKGCCKLPSPGLIMPKP